MVFQPAYIGRGERVTTEYANTNLRDRMNELYDLLFAHTSETTADLEDETVAGQTNDWQVISTIAAGELESDLYFKWLADVENVGVINGEIGWRLFGSDTVHIIKQAIRNDTSVSLKRLLHSVEDNEGIIEIVARNSATGTTTPSTRWDTDWNVRYRWKWTETSTETVRVPYQETIRVPYTATETETFTERVPYTVRRCAEYQFCFTTRVRRTGRTSTQCHASRSLAALSHTAGIIGSVIGGYTVSPIVSSCVRVVNVTRYREVQRTRQTTVTRYRNEVVTRYRNESRRTTVDRSTAWTTVRSGTASDTTEAASLAAARAAVNAVSVSTTGRPNSGATAEIERNVGTPTDHSSTTIVPAGDMNIKNITLTTQLFVGAASEMS